MTAAVASYRRSMARALRYNHLTWRLLNSAPSFSYAMGGAAALPSEGARVLRDLNRDGVALSSVDALGIPPPLFGELEAAVDALEKRRAADLAAARRDADDSSQIGTKTFNVELLGSNPTLDTDDVFCRFALQQSMLGISNSYFGMFTRLRYYNVWHTLATRAQPRESQLWHRDREDFLIMKAFVYLADVDRDAGPFTYAPGTHPKGRVSREPAFALEGGVRRTTDDQMAAIVARERWIEALGTRGTVVFTDTRGYHKGGLARGRDRLIYTCMFTSRVSQSRELFDRRRPIPSIADRAVAFAVR
jgi:hypothetical protein